MRAPTNDASDENSPPKPSRQVSLGATFENDPNPESAPPRKPRGLLAKRLLRLGATRLSIDIGEILDPRAYRGLTPAASGQVTGQGPYRVETPGGPHQVQVEPDWECQCGCDIASPCLAGWAALWFRFFRNGWVQPTPSLPTEIDCPKCGPCGIVRSLPDWKGNNAQAELAHCDGPSCENCVGCKGGRFTIPGMAFGVRRHVGYDVMVMDGIMHGGSKEDIALQTRLQMSTPASVKGIRSSWTRTHAALRGLDLIQCAATGPVWNIDETILGGRRKPWAVFITDALTKHPIAAVIGPALNQELYLKAIRIALQKVPQPPRLIISDASPIIKSAMAALEREVTPAISHAYGKKCTNQYHDRGAVRTGINSLAENTHSVFKKWTPALMTLHERHQMGIQHANEILGVWGAYRSAFKVGKDKQTIMQRMGFDAPVEGLPDVLRLLNIGLQVFNRQAWITNNKGCGTLWDFPTKPAK